MRDPSEFAKYLRIRLSLRLKKRAASLNPSPVTSLSTSRISAIFSSTGTSASFFDSGTDQFIAMESSCANVIFVFRREAVAILMASSTIPRTADSLWRRGRSAQSMPKGDRPIVLYPAYFDVARSRDQGRRVAKRWAVDSPTAQEVASAAKALGLEPQLEDGKAFPSTPSRKEGRVLVRADYYKTSIVQK